MARLIPTTKQWKKWSIPSRLTAVGACVGVVALLLTAASLGFQLTPRDDTPSEVDLAAFDISATDILRITEAVRDDYEDAKTGYAFLGSLGLRTSTDPLGPFWESAATALSTGVPEATSHTFDAVYRMTGSAMSRASTSEEAEAVAWYLLLMLRRVARPHVFRDDVVLALYTATVIAMADHRLPGGSASALLFDEAARDFDYIARRFAGAGATRDNTHLLLSWSLQGYHLSGRALGPGASFNLWRLVVARVEDLFLAPQSEIWQNAKIAAEWRAGSIVAHVTHWDAGWRSDIIVPWVSDFTGLAFRATDASVEIAASTVRGRAAVGLADTLMAYGRVAAADTLLVFLLRMTEYWMLQDHPDEWDEVGSLPESLISLKYTCDAIGDFRCARIMSAYEDSIESKSRKIYEMVKQRYFADFEIPGG